MLDIKSDIWKRSLTIINQKNKPFQANASSLLKVLKHVEGAKLRLIGVSFIPTLFFQDILTIKIPNQPLPAPIDTI